MNISTEFDGKLVGVTREIRGKNGNGHLTLQRISNPVNKQTFNVHYDSGGDRLAIDSKKQTCFVGCYRVHGMGAYSMRDGQEIWRRKDLKKIQSVSTFPFEDAVFCGREGAGHVLCSQTGKTITKTRGIKIMTHSPFDRTVLASGDSFELHRPYGTILGKIERLSFGLLSACFSKTAVLISESTQGLRCFDINSLEMLWESDPSPGYHFLKVGFCPTLQRFVGLRFYYIDRSDPDMMCIHFEPQTGKILKEFSIGTPTYYEFCQAGSHLISHEFGLISVDR